MGVIEPLPGFDYRTTQQSRVYKFDRKYFMTMGISRTTINNIVHIDCNYLSRIETRRRLPAVRPEILACYPDAEPAVRELYTYLVQIFLPERYPTIFVQSWNSQTLENKITGDGLPFTCPRDILQALQLLNAHVDDDFLFTLPSKRTDGAEGEEFFLRALVWAFPNRSEPSKRIGRSMKALHVRVPKYAEKLDVSMDRYFSRLETGQVVVRSNWGVSIKASQTSSQLTDADYLSEPSGDVSIDKIFVRCELQTLFKLPASGARVLSIHEYVYPLQDIIDDGQAQAMLEAIDGLKKGNVPEIWNYKRASTWSDQVKKLLNEALAKEID
ncbi:hypothetical protein LTR84_008572 [Exophiala bonariae]|uniref:HNH nuclease domain-containing protein n=1 Tax=Exophiala bonariae TaxID=1690606 RepID=A0AAV9N0E2_9EURO|nr:hypothetical protein LTR84_008572 [Exophiala bonariae]